MYHEKFDLAKETRPMRVNQAVEIADFNIVNAICIEIIKSNHEMINSCLILNFNSVYAKALYINLFYYYFLSPNNQFQIYMENDGIGIPILIHFSQLFVFIIFYFRTVKGYPIHLCFITYTYDSIMNRINLF